MTTLPDRPNSAVVVIDVQRGVVANAVDRESVISNIGSLVDRARSAGTTVIWVQHSSDELVPGSDEWALVPELTPQTAEPLIHKEFGDAFEATDLESTLASGGIGRLIVAGAQSDACIRSTIHGGFVRGYDVTLVLDAHTTEDLSQWGAPPPADVIAHTNLYWQFQGGPGRVAEVVATDGVTFT